MSQEKGYHDLQDAINLLSKLIAEDSTTDRQRYYLGQMPGKLASGRSNYEKALREVREKNLEEALAGFWQIIEDTPQLEIDPLDEDISLFFSNPPESSDTLDDNEDE